MGSREGSAHGAGTFGGHGSSKSIDGGLPFSGHGSSKSMDWGLGSRGLSGSGALGGAASQSFGSVGSGDSALSTESSGICP